MFDDKQIEEFRQIRAPGELRAKILSQKTVRYRNPAMRYAAMAACTVFLVTAILLFFPMGSGIAVTADGQKVTADWTAISAAISDEPVAYALARSANPAESLEIPLDFTADGTCTVTVSAGEISADGMAVEPGMEFEADKNLQLIWRISPADRDTVYSLVLHSGGEKTVLVMKYDNGWKIRLNEN